MRSPAHTASDHPSSTPFTGVGDLPAHAPAPAPTSVTSSHRFSATRIALVSAVSALLLWATKSAAIATAGGLDRSPFESTLFLAGLAVCLTAALLLGIALTRGSRPWVRVIAALAGPVAGVVVSVLLNALVVTFRDPYAGAHWVWAEVNLWVVGVTVLALSVLVHRRAGREPEPR